MISLMEKPAKQSVSWDITDQPIEAIVRQALTQGELWPGAAAEISRRLAEGQLSRREEMLIQLLEDAIANRSVRRIPLQ